MTFSEVTNLVESNPVAGVNRKVGGDCVCNTVVGIDTPAVQRLKHDRQRCTVRQTLYSAHTLVAYRT